MKRILYITNGVAAAAGLERVLSIKASYLADKMGYEVHILTLNEEGIKPFYEFSPQIRFHSIRVQGNPLKYLKSYLSGLRKKVKEIAPDIISVCDDGLKGFFVPLYLNKPCPMIYERHVSKVISEKKENWVGRAKTKLLYALMSTGARLYDKFVVLTDKNKLEWNLPNMMAIPNPLSFYPEQSSDLQNKKAITVGRLSYQKGQDYLIDCWHTIAEKHPDWQLDFYGKKNNLKMYNELISKNSLTDKITIHDPDPNILEKYLESSIYILPSRFEGFGMVLIEAMACGLPCVAFDCPYGPSDIITEGEDGFLVPVGDLKTMTEKILFLIENESERIRMGQNAKKNVKCYLPENVMNQWDDLFSLLIENKQF